MPWKEMSVMSQRREFVELAQAEGTNKRGLCRRFGISPTTGYKWLGRFREGSEAGPWSSCRGGLTTRLHVPHRRLSRRCCLPVRPIRPGELVSCDGGFWTAGMCLRRTCRPPVLSRRSCVVMAALTPPRGPNTVPGSDLNTRHPTTCGRWTSKATSPLPEDAATL